MRSIASSTRAIATSRSRALPLFYGSRTRAVPEPGMFCASGFTLFPGGQAMRTKLSLVSVVAALVCAGAALAGNGNGHGKFLYVFTGQLTATPANGGVSITVEGGNQAALRAM